MSRIRSVISVGCAGFDLLGEMRRDKRSVSGTKAWGLPAGEPEGTETPLEAAMRELREETGRRLPAKRFRYLGKVRFEDHDRVFYVFRVEFGQDERPADLKPTAEFTRFQWFEEEKLPWKNLLPEHPHWLPHIISAAKKRRGAGPISILVPKITSAIKTEPAA